MTRKQLIELMNERKLELRDNGDALSVDAPTGYTLKGDDVHSRVYYRDGYMYKGGMADLYKYIAEDCSGIEKCEDEECDSCIHEPVTSERLTELYGDLLTKVSA